MSEDFFADIDHLASLLASRIIQMREVDGDDCPERSLKANLGEYLGWALEECITNDGVDLALTFAYADHAAG